MNGQDMEFCDFGARAYSAAAIVSSSDWNE